jgi:histidyl-tRNA synthetase
VEGVLNEMRGKNISEKALDKLKPLFNVSGSNQEKLGALEQMLSDSKEGAKGVEELGFVMNQVELLGLQSSKLVLDLTLARGLNYYTGAIFEVQADKVQMGSIGGGGRYDDLTGIFGLKDISGIGISFGLDRIYLVMEELGLFENAPKAGPQVLFINFGDQETFYSLKALQSLRNAGIRSEMYPSSAKLKKQMNYADKKEIPFVVLVGEEEMLKNEFTLKNMLSGAQTNCNLDDLIRLILP